MNDSIGSLIQKQRLARRLTLDDMHTKTKLSVRLLKALEDDDRAAFPGEIYYIGALKTCARMLGLDPAQLVCQAKTAVEEPIMPAAASVEPAPAPQQPVRLSVVRVTLAVVALSAALAVLMLSRCRMPVQPAAPEHLPSQAVAPVASAPRTEPAPVAAEAAVKPLPVATPTVAAEPVAVLKLDIGAAHDSWIKVVADDMTAYQAIMRAGARQAWEAARSFRVVIGYTAGISTMTVNGIPVDLSPAASGIAELFISTGGIKVGTIAPANLTKNSPQSNSLTVAPHKRPQ